MEGGTTRCPNVQVPKTGYVELVWEWERGIGLGEVYDAEILRPWARNLKASRFKVGSIPHPVMGTARDYCRYITALLTPYLQATIAGGIDLILKYLEPKKPLTRKQCSMDGCKTGHLVAKGLDF